MTMIGLSSPVTEHPSLGARTLIDHLTGSGKARGSTANLIRSAVATYTVVDRNGGADGHAAYAIAMPAEPAHTVRCLKAFGARSVWLVDRPGETRRTLKQWPLTPLRLLKMFFLLSQPQQQIRGYRRLRRAGVATPRPVGGGVWRPVWSGSKPLVRLEFHFVEGRSALEFAATRPEHARARRLARRCGSIAKVIADAGLVNRDLKLENLIVEEDPASDEVWVIDPVGVRRSRDRIAALVRMIDRIYVQVCDREIPTTLRQALLRGALEGWPRDHRRRVLKAVRKIRYPVPVKGTIELRHNQKADTP